MKLLEKVRLLLIGVIVLGMGFSSVKAADVTVGGSLELLMFKRLAGGEAKEGKSSIWNKASWTARNQDILLTHVHPTFGINISEKVDGEVMICFSDYHQPQVWIAQMEYTPIVSEEFGDNPITIRAGRFLVPFGYFNDAIGQHSVNMKAISRPLIYASHDQEDIGLAGGPRPPTMTPFFDTGMLFYGNKYLREQKDNLWYGVYLTAGMFYHINNYNVNGALELDWEGYHIERMKERDTNNNKAIGGRIVYSLGETLTLGSSYQTGKYDPQSELSYSLVGADLGFALGKANLRFEYSQNPIEWISPSGAEVAAADIYTLGTRREYTKKGWYAQLDFPFTLFLEETDLTKKFEGVMMFSTIEGARDKYNNTHSFNALSRFSIGVNFAPEPALVYKLEYQLTMPEDYNASAANVTKYGEGFDNLSRIQMSVGLAF